MLIEERKKELKKLMGALVRLAKAEEKMNAEVKDPPKDVAQQERMLKKQKSAQSGRKMAETAIVEWVDKLVNPSDPSRAAAETEEIILEPAEA